LESRIVAGVAWSGLAYAYGIAARQAPSIEQYGSLCVAVFRDRELHLVKKALAIATLAIELHPGPFQSASDQADMKALLDEIIESDVELAYYVRSARIAVTGKPD
jgi:hypothetical protein